MLLVLAASRQFVARARRATIRIIWGAVFPLVMYSEATRQAATTFDLRFLDVPAHAIFVVSLIAWVLAFAGMLWHLGKATPDAKGRRKALPGSRSADLF